MSDAGSGGPGRATSGAGAAGGPLRRLRLRPGVAVAVARPVCVAVGLVAAYYLLPLDEQRTPGASAVLAGGLLAVLLVFGWEVRAITRAPYPRLRAVEGLAATVVLFLVLFAGCYYMLGRSAPGSFSEPLSRTDALYFTLTTFSTVGYGDITARSQTGRMLAMLQMAGGLLLVGVAARVLAGAMETGLKRRNRRNPQHREPPPEPRTGPDTAEPGPDVTGRP
ncbi:MAG TPA: potassium channel family protein [Streptomyces sp.]|nr:potassium channel family protein [Streptomyces sp.]